MTVDHARLELPFPPSVNGLFAGKQRRHLSDRYKSWKEEARLAFLRQRPLPHIRGEVLARYSFRKPDNRKRDLDNLAKAVNDALVQYGIIEDDSKIREITLRWDDSVDGVRVEIEQYKPHGGLI